MALHPKLPPKAARWPIAPALTRRLGLRRALVWIGPASCAIHAIDGAISECPLDEIGERLARGHSADCDNGIDIALDIAADTANALMSASAAQEPRDPSSNPTAPNNGDRPSGHARPPHLLRVHVSSFIADLRRCLRLLGKDNSRAGIEQRKQQLWWQEWRLEGKSVRIDANRSASDLLNAVSEQLLAAGIEINRIHPVSASLPAPRIDDKERAVFQLSLPCEPQPSFLRINIHRGGQLLCTRTVPTAGNANGEAGGPDADAIAVAQCLKQLGQFLDRHGIERHPRACAIGHGDFDWRGIAAHAGIEIDITEEAGTAPTPTEDGAPEAPGGEAVPTHLAGQKGMVAEEAGAAPTPAEDGAPEAPGGGAVPTHLAGQQGMVAEEAGAAPTPAEDGAPEAPGGGAVPTHLAGQQGMVAEEAGAAPTPAEDGAPEAPGGEAVPTHLASQQGIVAALRKRPWRRGRYLSRALVRTGRRRAYTASMAATAFLLASAAVALAAISLYDAIRPPAPAPPAIVKAAPTGLERKPEYERDLSAALWLDRLVKTMPAPRQLLAPASWWLESHQGFALNEIQWLNSMAANDGWQGRSDAPGSSLRLLLRHDSDGTDEASPLDAPALANGRRWSQDGIDWSLEPYAPEEMDATVISDSSLASGGGGEYTLMLRQ